MRRDKALYECPRCATLEGVKLSADMPVGHHAPDEKFISPVRCECPKCGHRWQVVQED